MKNTGKPLAYISTKNIEAKICPDCGVSRQVLKEILNDTPGSDNWENGRKILGNCKYCREAIG